MRQKDEGQMRAAKAASGTVLHVHLTDVQPQTVAHLPQQHGGVAARVRGEPTRPQQVLQGVEGLHDLRRAVLKVDNRHLATEPAGPSGGSGFHRRGGHWLGRSRRGEQGRRYGFFRCNCLDRRSFQLSICFRHVRRRFLGDHGCYFSRGRISLLVCDGFRGLYGLRGHCDDFSGLYGLRCWSRRLKRHDGG